MTPIFTQKVTIYNDIQDGSTRRFDRFVIDTCVVGSGYVEKADGTVQIIANVINVITKDVNRYKSPEEYKKLTIGERNEYYTVQINDIVVLAEVFDEADNYADFRAIRDKYENNSISVTAANAYIYGMATDNITMTNA